MAIKKTECKECGQERHKRNMRWIEDKPFCTPSCAETYSERANGEKDGGRLFRMFD